MRYLKNIFFLFFLIISFFSFGQVSESFDGWSDASYGTISTWTDGSGGQWESYNTMCEATNARSGNAIRFNDDSSENEYLLYKGTDGNGKDNGIGTISFWYRHWNGDASIVQFQVQYNQSGGGWTNVGSVITVPNNTTYNQFIQTTNLLGNDFLIRVISIDDAERLLIDDFLVTDYTVAGPTITLNSSMSNFGSICVGSSSTEQSYTVEGTNLTNDIIITAPTNFEISETSGSGYASPITLTQSGGNVATTTIYVRYSPTTSGVHSENIVHTSTGASNQNASVSGTGILDIPTITTAAVSNITSSSADCGGNVTSDNCSAVTSRGVCWNTTGTPTIADSKTTDGSGTGVFTSSLSGLINGTIYYVRAYATNSQGTGYGNEVTFVANDPPCLEEGFNAGASAPTGWTFSGITGTYTTPTNYGVSSPSISFDDTGDAIETPTVSGPTTLSFWIKGQGTNASSALLVEGWDGTWNTIDNITNSIPTTGTIMTYNSGISSYTKFRFTYTKSSGNLAFDDVTVYCSCIAPTTQATSVSINNIYSTQFTANWTNGNGTKRIVKINTSSTFTPPVDGVDPVASSVYGGGEQVVYNGIGSSVIITGLSASTTYWIMVYEANCSGTNIIYNFTIPGVGNNPNSGTTNTTVPPSPTTILPGDLAVLGLCSNLNPSLGPHCIPSASAGDDEISFVCFRTINTGTAIEMTDNGWERCNAGQWGNSEGVIQAVRTGGAIPAGTVITFRFTQSASGTYTSFSPDAGWSISEIHTQGTDLIMNSGGDQIFFMQGGTWDYGTGPNTHDATLSNPNILFGFNANNQWVADCGSTQESNPYPNLDCFSMMPGVASDFIKYTGAVDGFGIASQREWIRRINDPNNWTSYGDCSGYYSDPVTYHTGWTISIGFGGFTDGRWTGTANTDWFDCRNWESMRIPDPTIVVTIPNVTNDPIIGDAGAECNDINIYLNASLEINNPISTLDVYGDFVNNGTLIHTDGLVTLNGPSSFITTSTSLSFYNFEISKANSTDIVTLNNDIEVSNTLTLTNGLITTGINRVNVSNPLSTSIVGHDVTRYINGNLRRNVNSIGSYDFPVGTADQYEIANINLNSSTGTTYIDANFTTPHSTPIDISSLGLLVNGTQVTTLLDYGFWTISPDAYTTIDYNVTLTSRGHSNGGATADQHTIVKRIDAANDWNVYPVNHNNATQSGTGTNPITAVLTNMTDFSDFAIARSTNFVLPIELLSFEAKLKDDIVELNWLTESETNNDYFTIERSADGKKFNEIARTLGVGNSNSLLMYSAYDRDPIKGINYYKLKQYDIDGKSTISDIVTINVLSSNNQGFVSDITINDFMVNINLLESQEVKIQLIDITGKILSSSIENDSQINLDIKNLAQGYYFIRISSDSDIFNYQFYR